MFFFFSPRKERWEIWKMGLLGDFAKGLIVYTVVLWVFAIIQFVAMGQVAIALLLLFVLMIPVSMIALEYLRNRKKERT